MDKKKRKIKSLLEETGALKFGDFELSSGKKSDYYIDIKKASTFPTFLKLIGNVIAEKSSEIDKLAGVALGGVPLVVSASIYSKKPYLMIRKEKKEYGTSERIEGNFSKEDKIMMVEDVTTTGKSLYEAVKTLRDLGTNVNKAIVVVDRNEGAKEFLKSHKIDLISILEADEILKE